MNKGDIGLQLFFGGKIKVDIYALRISTRYGQVKKESLTSKAYVKIYGRKLQNTMVRLKGIYKRMNINSKKNELCQL